MNQGKKKIIIRINDKRELAKKRQLEIQNWIDMPTSAQIKSFAAADNSFLVFKNN